MARDITIQVAVEASLDNTSVEIKVSGGSEHHRADVTEMVLLHLNALWEELGPQRQSAFLVISRERARHWQR